MDAGIKEMKLLGRAGDVHMEEGWQEEHYADRGHGRSAPVRRIHQSVRGNDVQMQCCAESRATGAAIKPAIVSL